MDHFICPEYLKDAVRERFKKGAGTKLSHLFKIGMRSAIQELRDETEDSNLDHHPLQGVPEVEIDALQAVYKYLKSRGLTWTLECLTQEANVDEGASTRDVVVLAKLPARIKAVSDEVLDDAESVRSESVVTAGDEGPPPEKPPEDQPPEIPDGGSEPEKAPEPEPEKVPEPEPEKVPEPEPEKAPEPEPEPEKAPEPEPEPEKAPEPEPEKAPEPEPEPEPEKAPEPEPEPEKAPEADPEPEKAPESEPEPEKEAEPESSDDKEESATEPEAATDE
jgi:hypothetical protein